MKYVTTILVYFYAGAIRSNLLIQVKPQIKLGRTLMCNSVTDFKETR